MLLTKIHRLAWLDVLSHQKRPSFYHTLRLRSNSTDSRICANRIHATLNIPTPLSPRTIRVTIWLTTVHIWVVFTYPAYSGPKSHTVLSHQKRSSFYRTPDFGATHPNWGLTPKCHLPTTQITPFWHQTSHISTPSLGAFWYSYKLFLPATDIWHRSNNCGIEHSLATSTDNIHRQNSHT